MRASAAAVPDRALNDYDVAFSYAGEQRWYVDPTYHALTQLGISVFYDASDIANLWGTNLYERLTDIYQHRARYCVLFLSKDYANKLWAKHEVKIAQAREFQESREYILPARFDDTEIPGLLPTIAYIDLNGYSPEQFANLISDKLRAGGAIGQQSSTDPNLEANLVEFVIWAQEYLRPQQSVILSDAIAESVRVSFQDAGLQPRRQHLLPYIRNQRAEYRVVGYLAFQANPVRGMVLDLITSLNHERVEASERKDTRPLWQLLLCFTDLVQNDIHPADHDLIRKALSSFLEFLLSNSEIDAGGECKERIELIINYR